MGSDPTYDSVCRGDGHTEAIRVEYDPEKVSYEDLLKVFFNSHSPCRGDAQYKSAIWYHDEEQREIAEAVCKANGNRGAMVDVGKEQPWWDAEEYHQKFYQKSGGGGGW